MPPIFVNSGPTTRHHEERAQRTGDECEGSNRQERQFETLGLNERPSRLSCQQISCDIEVPTYTDKAEAVKLSYSLLAYPRISRRAPYRRCPYLLRV